MPLNIVVTNAGRAAIVNAQNTGTAPVTITQIGLSQTAVVPLATDTVLAGEFKRIAGVAGEVVADDTIHLTITDEGADAYTLRSIGLYLADGTLFAIYGQAGAVLEKTASSIAALSVDVIFADISAAALTFGNANFTNPPATTERQGVVELATTAEAQAGIDALRALTPAAAKAAILGWLLAQDGAGSGLDADLLDGQDGSYYTNIPGRLGYTPANKAGDTFTGAIRRDAGFYMDLSGGVPMLFFADDAGGADRISYDRANNVFAFNIGGTDVVKASAAGLNIAVGDLTIGRTSDAWGYIIRPNSAGYKNLAFAVAGGGALDNVNINSVVVTIQGNTVWHAANDGSGSGLDADLLDGQHGSYYLAASSYTAADIRAKLLTVDGAGSGIDADLLDGLDAAAFARRDGVSNTARDGGVVVAGSNASEDVWSAGLQIREVNYAGNGQSGSAYAPALNFHWSGIAAAAIKMTSDGHFRFRAQGTDPNVYRNVFAANFYSNGSLVWSSGNDGAGSGLDADLLDGQDSGYYTNIVARLGYTPVRQGGGAGQGTNTVHIGWSGSRVKMQVDATDQGNVVFDGHISDVWRSSNDGSGSGMDADMVDGWHRDDIRAWGNLLNKPFNWSGQGGQPNWLWGSNDGSNYYVWNPSNFSVNYANSAGALSTASGSAPSYAARAWVKFNGTGTVAINGAGNVSSITDNGVGNYTVNFATAMPDAEYAAVVSRDGGSITIPNDDAVTRITSLTANSFVVQCWAGSLDQYRDASPICCIVVR